jgi:aldehyde dehydrogenase (NAD+)
VPRSLLAQATEIAAAVMPQIPYGDPNDMNNLMGPLVSRRQLDRVLGYLEVGRQEARLVTGGGRAEQFERGYYVQPTVFTDVPATARIAREEIFGPVLSIIPFEDDADAVRIANDSSYGLSGAVYSGDPERALRVARGLRTGSVAINGGNFQAPDTPFGGYKQSGIGREFGVQGFEDFLETKALGIPV